MKVHHKISLIIILIILILVNIFVLNEKPDPFSSAEVKSSGNALIGGDFALVNQYGETITQQDLKGKFSLIYFGFTNCPMICPTALSTISLAIDALGDKADQFQSVFITTDPERDTTDRLKGYLQSFDTKITGLTGTQAQLKPAYDAYKVYAKKVDIIDDENYDMNHSSIIYVMNKDGEYITHFNHQSPVEEITAKLSPLAD